MTKDAAQKVVSDLKATLQNEAVTLGMIAQSIGHHGTFTFIFVPALLVTTPLSGIPGLSAIMGTLIAIAAFQIVIGRSSVWLPGWLQRREIKSDRFENVMNWLERAADFVNRHTRERLQLLVSAVARRVIATICLLCGAVMPLLEFIPFTSSILGAFMTILSGGVLLRDGVVVALALIPLAAGGWLFLT